jgi:hypothetical protein
MDSAIKEFRQKGSRVSTVQGRRAGRLTGPAAAVKTGKFRTRSRVHEKNEVAISGAEVPGRQETKMRAYPDIPQHNRTVCIGVQISVGNDPGRLFDGTLALECQFQWGLAFEPRAWTVLLSQTFGGYMSRILTSHTVNSIGNSTQRQYQASNAMVSPAHNFRIPKAW